MDDLLICKQADDEYVQWYQTVIDTVGTTGFLVMYAEYSDGVYCRVGNQTVNLTHPPKRI